MAERRVALPAEPLGIGERLRNAREAKGLTLRDMEGITRVRAIYLQALEDERFGQLPGPVYARGFLRTYASALGLDPDRLLETYPQLFAEPSAPSVVAHSLRVPILPAAPRSPLRRIGIYAIVLVVVALVGFGVIGYLQLREFSQPVPPEAALPAPAPAAPAGPPAPPAPPPQPPAQVAPAPPPPVVPETAPPAPEPPPAAPQEAPRPAAAAPPQAGAVTVEVRATGTSWLRVTADGERVFQGFVDAGDVRVWQAHRRLTLRVGNAPVLQVLVNGRLLPAGADRVWERTFTPP